MIHWFLGEEKMKKHACAYLIKMETILECLEDQKQEEKEFDGVEAICLRELSLEQKGKVF